MLSRRLFSGPSSLIINSHRYCNRLLKQQIGVQFRPLRQFHGSAPTRRLNRLAEDVERHPSDSQKLSAYFNALLESNMPQKVIEKFESTNSQMLDTACARAYVDALNRTGQGDKALRLVLNQSTIGNSFRSVKSDFGVASEASKPYYGHGSSSTQRPSNGSNPPGNMFNLAAGEGQAGSRENPMYFVQMKPASTHKDRLWNIFRLSLVLWGTFTLVSIFSEELTRGGAKNFTAFNEVNPETSESYSFEDVEGVDEAKEELQEIVEFLRDPAKFTRLGGKLPKGVLLTGPPGTGKTLLARAVAGEAGVPFFLCSGSEFDEMFVGVGAKRVRELFAAAKKHSPCIIFIDEIDAVGGMRNPRDQQYAKMTLNQLLVEMDGFSQNQGIIVIGATNFPEALDKALVRPGRFDRNIDVSLPDVQGRISILEVHTKTVPLSADVKLDIIARGCPGFSGADLANLINYAALKAASSKKNFVGMADFEWAKDRIIMGAEKKNAVLSEANRKIVAYHEAGHAIVALFTPGAMAIHKATIMPRGSALGLVAQLPENDELNWTKKQLLARLDVAMGGRCAEELKFGPDEITAGASSDIDAATNVARSMITRLGMGSKAVGRVAIDKNDYGSLSSETRATVEHEVRDLIDSSYSRVKDLLKSKSKEWELLAQALLEHETLSREDIENVIKGKPPTFTLRQQHQPNKKSAAADLLKKPSSSSKKDSKTPINVSLSK